MCPEKTPCCPDYEKNEWVSRYKRLTSLVNFSKTQTHYYPARKQERTLFSAFKKRTLVVLRHHWHRQSLSSATCRLCPSLRQRGWRFRAPSSSSMLARGCRPWSLRRRRLRVWRGLPLTVSERYPWTWTWQAGFACEVSHGGEASFQCLGLGGRRMLVGLGRRLRGYLRVVGVVSLDAGLNWVV